MTDSARVATFPSLPPSRFPRWIINPLNPATLHYRSAALSQYILSKRLPKILGAPQPPDTRYVYATIISQNDKFLSYISLYSLIQSVSRIPSIVIGLDDDFPEHEAKKFFEPLQLPSIYFYSKSKLLASIDSVKCDNLSWFCKAHVFGFKLSLNLLLSSSRAVLYADSDVLWFGDIANSAYFDCSKPFIAASIDSGVQPYDPVLMESLSHQFSFDTLLTPNGCAGVCLFGQDPKLINEIDVLVGSIRRNHVITRLTEQTIVSALSKRDGTFLSHLFISMDPYTTVLSRSLSATFSLGRHYPANWRTQFWIDALHLIL